MIIAKGFFGIGLVMCFLSLIVLKNGLDKNKAFTWDLKPFFIGLVISLVSAQYIWG